MKPRGNIEWLNREQSYLRFDKAARFHLNISGEEFINLYNSGKLDVDGENHSAKIKVAMLMPSYRIREKCED